VEEVSKPSLAKSLVAQTKPRVGGRFISLKDETPAEKPKTSRKKKEAEITKDELTYDTRLLTEEEKEYIGEGEGMAYRFYEIALKKARTAAEAHRYASILIQYQTAKVSAKEAADQLEITHKVLKWGWDGANDDSRFEKATEEILEKEVRDGAPRKHT
jgi:hypothetical protein